MNTEKLAMALEEIAKRLRAGVADQGLLDAAAYELEQKARELRLPPETALPNLKPGELIP